MTDNILNSISILLEKIYKSVEGNVYELLDKLINISPQILEKDPLKYVFKDSEKSGVIFIATSLILFYAIQYIIQKLVAMYNGKNPENVFKFIIRVVLCTTIASSSKYICELVLEINSIFTDLIGALGENITGEKISFISFREVIINLEKYMSQDALSLDGLIKGFISYGAVTLVINYAVRYVTIIFTIMIMPIMIMFSISPMTRGIFNSWVKISVINLCTQWIVKFLLIIPISFRQVDDEMFKIIIIGTIYLLYRINMFVKELFGNITAIKADDYKKVF